MLVQNVASLGFSFIFHLREAVVQFTCDLLVVVVKIGDKPKIIKRMLDAVVPHVAHQIWQHRVYVLAFPHPSVDGSPCKIMPQKIKTSR